MEGTVEGMESTEWNPSDPATTPGARQIAAQADQRIERRAWPGIRQQLLSIAAAHGLAAGSRILANWRRY
jgi:hypothetical protein